MLGLALVTLLAVGALIVVLLRPTPSPVAPTAVAGAELPDQSERWRVLTPLPAPRADGALAAVNLGGTSYLYSIGGEHPKGVSADVLRYDPVAGGIWSSYTPKPTPVADVQAVVIGGKIYVPGGRTADGAITNVFEVYDPQLDTWTPRESLPEPRSRYALAAVEGKLYLFGGWDDRKTFTKQVWRYTPDTDKWDELTPMSVPRADAGAATLDDQIFLIGGENSDGLLTRHERYTPADEAPGNPWTIRAPLPAPRSRIAVASANDRFFVLGGGQDALSYSSARDAWQTTPPLPFDPATSGVRAQLLGNSGNSRIYLVGGRTQSGLSDQVSEYLALFTTTVPISGQ